MRHRPSHALDMPFVLFWPLRRGSRAAGHGSENLVIGLDGFGSWSYDAVMVGTEVVFESGRRCRSSVDVAEGQSGSA